MKYQIRLYQYLCFAFCLIMLGCKYDTDIPNPELYAKVYMPQAAESSSKHILKIMETEQTIIFGAAYGGPDYPQEDIKVKFKVSDDLVAEFNQNNGTSYLPLPKASYTIDNLEAEIGRNTLSSAPLKIKVKTKDVLTPFVQYLLPVTIESISGNVPLNEKLKTAYFLVEAQKDGINIRVMSFGIKSGTVDMNAVADIVNSLNPDLLVIREIDSATTRSGNPVKDFPKILSGLINMPNYVYAPAFVDPFQNGQYGTVVYSKYPITEKAKYKLASTASEKGPLAIVKVKVNNQYDLVFAGTHLSASAAIRDPQANQLLDIMSTYGNVPVIVAGNFNDKATTGTVYQKFASQYTFPCVTCQLNYPKAAPTGNSDMLMFKPSDRFRVLSYTLGTASTSDHLPVVADLQMFY